MLDNHPNYTRKYIEDNPLVDRINEYQFLNPGVNGSIDIFTYGADGEEGGEEMNADIGSWNLDEN